MTDCTDSAPVAKRSIPRLLMTQAPIRRTTPAPLAQPQRVANTTEIAPATLGQIGDWVLTELLAEGAVTRVYRARPRHATTCPPAYAIKVLQRPWEDNAHAVGLLRREAAVGRRVAHPHLIAILAASTFAPPYYVVMPWLHGATLGRRLAQTPRLDPPLAFWVARQTAEALNALHRAGWMHGDVKPENVFLSPEGHVTLLDLGFARRTDGSEKPCAHRLMGTSYYLAPELAARPPRGDIRSDLYSLGVVLFEMLAGQRPFAGTSLSDVLQQHRQARAPDLGLLAPGLPDDAYVLVRQLLAKEPLRRPSDPAEVIARLVALEIATFSERTLIPTGP